MIFDCQLVLIFNMRKLEKLRFQKMIPELFYGSFQDFFGNEMIVIGLLSFSNFLKQSIHHEIWLDIRIELKMES